jgi:hypothetical protein
MKLDWDDTAMALEVRRMKESGRPVACKETSTKVASTEACMLVCEPDNEDEDGADGAVAVTGVEVLLLLPLLLLLPVW